MHEVAVMQGAIQTILEKVEQMGAVRVLQVSLTLGVSGHMTEASARQYFELLARDTVLDGAALDVSWLPAVYQCFDCALQFTSIAEPEYIRCPACAGVCLEIAHRDECYVSSIEVAAQDQVSDETPGEGAS